MDRDAFRQRENSSVLLRLRRKTVPRAAEKWKYTAARVESDEPEAVEYLYTYLDRSTGLQVECRVKGFTDFDAVEWVLNFKNDSQANSASISQVKVVDLDFEYPQKGNFILHYADGSHVSKHDFHQRTKVLAPGDSLYMAPQGGRSSQVAFPFFNIESPAGQGVMVAVGWTGTWFADIAGKTDRSVTLASGMKYLDTYLYPQESIRTPSICLLFWKGDDRMVGHNRFRRFVMAHHTPKVDGKPAHFPESSSFNYGDPSPCNEYTCLTADYAIALIRRYKQFDIVPEVFWLDAGWYSQAADYKNHKNWANTVGNWTVDREKFPDGLKPVSDEAHKVGAKFMVWFEPERVIKGSQWAEEHPEWMLDAGTDAYLFDLGNPKALEWFCDQIGELIEQNGIDYYRQDFNMEPDIFWQKNDEPGRTGIREIRHIEGLYAFWDYLRQRFPGLLVDNCASGGRRIDLEATSRSAPMWQYRLQLRRTGRLPVPYLRAGDVPAAARHGRAEDRQVYVPFEPRHFGRLQLEDHQRLLVVLRNTGLHEGVPRSAALFLRRLLSADRFRRHHRR